MASCAPGYFELFVTCVDKFGPMLKIWGQTDRVSSMHVEQLCKSTAEHFENQPFIPNISNLSVGLICCAKYIDGNYYRAQVISPPNVTSGSVEVKFIDYGNEENIELENIRILHNVPTGLTSIKPQAVDFILAGVIHINRNWDQNALSFVHHEIAYVELQGAVVRTVGNTRLINIIFHNQDLSEYLVQKGVAMLVPVQTQEIILRGPQGVNTPTLPNVPSPVACRPPIASPQSIISPVLQIHDLCSYKPISLEPNSEHMVYVSYVEDGPYLFSIQLQSMEDVLEKLMSEINQLPLVPLAESPIPGYPCIARCIEDNSLCRSVVTNLVEDKCKTYYVDFGNTDILPFTSIFQIPFKYLIPKVMSMRFTLAGLKKINVTSDMKSAFKEYVTNKLLRLKVLKLEGSPVLPYCELYDGDNNIINVLYESCDVYKTNIISKGLKYNVIVSFIEGCKRFFVQLKDSSDSLNSLMRGLERIGNVSPVLNKNELHVGLPCCAFYSGDNQWYRAQIVSLSSEIAIVKYVDYGNEESVPIQNLRKISSDFIKILPAQAIECCLYGYQNMSFNSDIEHVFESLTLECEFSMKVISKQNNEILLVDLFDSDGNNVAALLIEKLAALTSQISPLSSHRLATSILNKQLTSSPESENGYSPPRSNREKPTWRNTEKTARNFNNDRNCDDNRMAWNSSGDDRRSRNFGDKQTFNSGDKQTFNSGEKQTFNSGDKQSWNSGDKQSWKAGSDADNRKSWRNGHEEKKTWRNNDEAPTNDRADNWNGDSPTNKRSFQRNDRNNKYDRNDRERSRNNNYQRDGQKFRSDRFNDNKSSPDDKDSGKGNSHWTAGSGSEKSWSGSVGSRSGKNLGPKQDFNKQSRKPNDYGKRKPELPPQDLSPLEEPFKFMEIPIGSNDTVSISWFYNPESFYLQILSHQKEFRDMMCDIQSAYNGRPALDSEIPVGSSIIAEFHEDSILYRAIVLENKHPKYKVQYVDFGNVSLVDCSKIWQVETKFMTRPIQAIKCGLTSLKATDGNWPVSEVIDNIFNKESFTCTFESFIEDQYSVQLFDNDVNLKQQLIDSGIATDAAAVCEMADEPVELNMLVGQNINVHVSFISGLNKFYIQFDKLKAIQVQEYINTFMSTAANINALQQFTVDQLTIGSTCLVKTDEEKWFRGVIMTNTDSNVIQVDFPDFGGSTQLPVEKLFYIPPQLCVHWYQSFECTLHNLTADVNRLVSDDDFKQNYEGQDLIMYVDEVANGRPIVTLYELSGLKLSVFEPDEGAFASVEPLSPFPVLHSTLTVWVSHVNSFDSLYMQRSCDIEKIAQLIETLFEYYESQGEQTEYVEGALCAAKSVSDDNWYRARMEEMSDEGVKVTYIDYGNSEILPITNLKSLDPAFFTPHEFALHVGLNVKELSQDLTNKIKELTADKEFKATVWYAESGWLAEILDGEISINQTLIELNLACPQEEVEVVQDISDEIKQTEEKSEPVVDGSRAQVRITHIDSPSEFYVQLVANEEVVSNLQAELQEEILTLPALEGADVGVLCAAKYSVDEQWYRAEVLDADADITTVRFVDYGNTDVIDNKNSAIKILPADLLAIDKFSAKCSLNYKPIKGEEWSQEACEMFENALNVDLIYADIVYQDEKNKTYVELFIDGTEKNVAELLTKAQLAVPIVRDAEESIASNTGFISHLNSASEFWIQLESSVPDLEMIVDRLATAESFPDLHDLSPGVLCAANFPDDEMWYRARILSNTVAGIEVLFVDYGNSSTAMKLKVLPEDLIQMPALAQKCSLNKPQTVAQWSDQATEKFREISEEGATIFTIKKFTTGETSTVELFINDVNITEQLISLCETGAFRMTPNYVKVNVTYVESPEKFWIQLMSDSLVAESVLESLATASDLKHVTEWKENTIYAALFDDNGLWYRVKVLSQSEQYEVHLIDYGNVIQTSDIREISESLEKIPQLATLCSLEFPKSVTKWTDDAASKFANFTADVYTEFELEFLNEESPRLVRLYREGKNIAEEIILETPQALLQSSSTTSLVSDMVTLSEEQIKSPVPKSVEEENIKEIEGSVLQTTLYEECDSTLKEVDATFASCGDITASEITLETDNNEVVNEVKPEDLIEDQSFSELKLDDKLVVEGNSSSELSNKLTETQVVSELPNKFTESQVVVSRPTTPHCDKIVPGSVSRGDLEVPPLDIISTLDLNQSLDLIEDLASQQTEKLAVLDEIPKENTADDIKYEALLEANRSRSSTPRCDKVVPGSISRDDLEVPSVERYETVFVTEVDIYVEDVEIDQRQGDTVVSSETSVTNVLDPPNLSSVDKIDDLLINKVDLTKHDISNAEEVVVVDHSQGNTVATSQPCQEAIVLNSLNLPSDNEIDTIINKENLVENVSGTPGKMCRGILEQILLTANNIGNINLTEASDTQSSKETEEIGIQESQRLLETKKSKHKEMKEKQSKKQETKEEKGEEIENLEHDYAKAKEVEKVPSRPMTPRVEKIVPGSICRGDLEEPLISTEKVAKENKIVPGSISRGTSLEEIEDPSLEIEDSSLETPRTPTNRTFSGNMHVPVTLKTRTEDKILPGAISLALNLDESNECASPIIPKTPTEDKIVPGSISRGMNLLDDTSEPSEISETSLDLDDTTDSMSVWPPTPRVKERNIVESVFSLDDKIDLSDSGDTPETLELAESDPESDNSKDSFFSGDMIDRQSSPLLSKDDSTIPEEDDNTIPEKDDNTMPDRTLDEPSVDKVVSGVPERNIYS